MYVLAGNTPSRLWYSSTNNSCPLAPALLCPYAAAVSTVRVRRARASFPPPPRRFKMESYLNTASKPTAIQWKRTAGASLVWSSPVVCTLASPGNGKHAVRRRKQRSAQEKPQILPL